MLQEIGDTIYETRWGPKYDQDSQLIGVLCVCVDVTEREHLLQEVADALAAQEEMAIATGHRLRTPLTLMLGYLDLAERHVARGEIGRCTGDLVRIRTATEQLRLMVEEIMTEAPRSRPAFAEEERLAELAEVLERHRPPTS